MRFRFFILAALTFALLPLHSSRAERQMEDMGLVVLRTIDKLSARTHTFDIPVDKTVKFGNSLFIKARACRKASPLDKPESTAFLQIWERKPSEKTSHWLFSGWMFASSPSLSSLDHPVYDVWVIECKNAATSKSASEFSSETAPAQSPDTQSPAASRPVKEEPAPEKPALLKPAARPKDDKVPPLEQLPGSFEGGELPGDGN
jgi:hypothetical protein